MSKGPSSASSGETEPMKMIHKDQEVMTCFCINQVTPFDLLLWENQSVSILVRIVLFVPLPAFFDWNSV